MLELIFNHSPDSSLKHILCIGAHSDDIEIGCFGTISRIIQSYPHVGFTWVVLGASQKRADEAFVSASYLLRTTEKKKIIIKNFRDGFFPYIGDEIKEFFESLKKEICPSLIFTHYRYDRHQDHKFVSDLTWSTFRDHLILEYEIFKYDGDLGSPNFFVQISQEFCDQKVNHLLTNFPSQLNRSWFTKDAFYALLRLRGIEANSSTNFSEAFYCRKLVF